MIYIFVQDFYISREGCFKNVTGIPFQPVVDMKYISTPMFFDENAHNISLQQIAETNMDMQASGIDISKFLGIEFLKTLTL